jgi:hypothetical protein
MLLIVSLGSGQDTVAYSETLYSPLAAQCSDCALLSLHCLRKIHNCVHFPCDRPEDSLVCTVPKHVVRLILYIYNTGIKICQTEIILYHK